MYILSLYSISALTKLTSKMSSKVIKLKSFKEGPKMESYEAMEKYQIAIEQCREYKTKLDECRRSQDKLKQDNEKFIKVIRLQKKTIQKFQK